MIGKVFFPSRKEPNPNKIQGQTAPAAQPPQHPGKPSRFMPGASEKTQDFLGGHDGERIGFRKPVQG
jgi:hypothetical protein